MEPFLNFDVSQKVWHIDWSCQLAYQEYMRMPHFLDKETPSWSQTYYMSWEAETTRSFVWRKADKNTRTNGQDVEKQGEFSS